MGQRSTLRSPAVHICSMLAGALRACMLAGGLLGCGTVGWAASCSTSDPCRNGGECFDATPPGGKRLLRRRAQETDPSGSGTDPLSPGHCDATDLPSRISAVNSDCCDELGGACSGLPAQCSLHCAGSFLPFDHQCVEQLLYTTAPQGRPDFGAFRAKCWAALAGAGVRYMCVCKQGWSGRDCTYPASGQTPCLASLLPPLGGSNSVAGSASSSARGWRESQCNGCPTTVFTQLPTGFTARPMCGPSGVLSPAGAFAVRCHVLAPTCLCGRLTDTIRNGCPG
jgi:hypothetical protein